MSLQPGSSYVNYLAVKKLLPLDEQANQYPSTTIFAVDGSGTLAGYAPANWFTAIGIPNPSTVQGELVSTIGVFNSAFLSTVAGLGSAGYVSTKTLDTALASTVGGLATTTGVTYAEFDAAIKGLGTIGYVSSSQLTSTVAGLGSSGYLSTAIDGTLAVSRISTGTISLSTVSLVDITNPASNTLLYNDSGNLYFGATLIGANPTDLSLNTIDVSSATVATTLTVGGSITAPISYSDIVSTSVVNATTTPAQRTWAVAGTFGASDYGTQFSTNNGVSWDLSAHLFAGATNGTTYLNGRWYALGLYGVLNSVDNMGIYYSTDNGTTWTAPPNPSGTNFINADIQGIAFNGTTYMLVGQKSGPRIWTSSDGINWTYITSPANMTSVYRVFNNGTYWVIIGQGTSPIQYSLDGTSWTAGTDSFTGLEFFKKLAFDGFTLVVADTNNGNITYSINKGLTWNTVAVGGTEMTALTWNGTYFVTATNEPALYYSRNARAWTRSPSTPSESVVSFFWNGRVIKGIGASTYTYESSDGISWTESAKTYTLATASIITYNVYTGDALITENGRYYGVDVPHFYGSTNQIFLGPNRIVLNNTLTIGNGVVGVMKGDPTFHVDIEGGLRASTIQASTIRLADPLRLGGGTTLYARGGSLYVNDIPIVQSTVAGLGQTYVSIPSLTSTVAGLGQTYVSVPSLTSTVAGIGNNLYVSSLTASTFTVTNNARIAYVSTLGISSASITAGVGSAGAPSYSFGGDTNNGIFSPSPDMVAVTTGGVERLRVDDGGRLGIGTTTPFSGYRVDISGDLGLGSGSKQIFFSENLDNKISLWGGTNTTQFHGFGVRAATLLYNVPDFANNHVFYASTTRELMRINGSGNVGIGTASPATQLDVSGALTLRGGNAGSSFFDASNTYITFAENGSSSDWVNLRQIGSNNSIALCYDFNDNLADVRFVLRNNPSLTAGAPWEVLRVDNDTSSFGSNGTMQVTQFSNAATTTVPTLNLRNTSNGHQLNFYTNLGTGNWNSIVQTNDKALIFHEGTQNTGNLVIAPWGATGVPTGIRMTTAGNVGIGRTPASGYALDVSGGYGRIQNYVNEAGLELLAGGTFSIRRTNGTNGDAQLYNFGTGSMNFATNGTSGRMVIDGSGSVAIGSGGVVNSVAKVTIQNDLCLVTGANSAGAGGSVYFGIEQFPTYSPMSQIKGVLTNQTGSELQGGIGFFTRPFGSSGQVLRERVRITNEGFVGIGISTPTQTLDVSGSARVTGALTKGSGTFDIQHPLHPSKRLIHSFIEGPRCDNIYRGVVQLVDGRATVNLDTECVHQPTSAMSAGTFEALCANPMVYLQNNESFDRVKGSVSGGTLIIECESPASIKVNWLVVAERKDPLVKEWDRTNEDGYLVTEYTP